MFYVLDSKTRDFHLLYQIDRELGIAVKNLLRFLTKFNHRNSVRFIKLSGSLTEGCYSPSLFIWDNRFDDNMQKSIDFDIEIPFLDFAKKYKHCVVNEDKKGFATISQKGDDCFCKECYSHLINIHKWDRNPKKLRDKLTDEEGYMLSYKLKNMFAVINDYPYNTGKSEKYIFAAMLQQYVKDVKTKQRDFKITKATFQMSYSVFVKKKLALLLSVDASVIIKLQWTSLFMEKWIRRSRAWPNMKDIRSVLNTTYLISKPSHEEKYSKKTREFPYSILIHRT